MSKRRKPKDAAAIVYKDPQTGVVTRHIDIPTAELPAEINRLSMVAQACYGKLKRIRDPHVIVRGVIFQLKHARSETLPASITTAEMVQEVGRLNAVLARCHAALERMQTSCPVLRQVGFELRYRQTSKKRDPEKSWNSNTKKVYRDRDDDQETREDD